MQATTTTIRLTTLDRRQIEAIVEAGFATTTSEAIRTAVTFLTMSLRQVSWPSSTEVVATARSAKEQTWLGSADKGAEADVDPHAIEAAGRALRIVKRGRCECRVDSGRHVIVATMLEMLRTGGWVPWKEIRIRSKAAAVRHNELHGTPESDPPAGVLYTSSAMGHSWLRGYIAAGARHGERYSLVGPKVRTEVRRTGKGTEIRLRRRS